MVIGNRKNVGALHATPLQKQINNNKTTPSPLLPFGAGGPKVARVVKK
jgi:hypothetical protein